MIKAVGICPNVSKLYAILNEVVVYYSNWNEAVWSCPKLNTDVPLGPKMNGAIIVCPELI